MLDVEQRQNRRMRRAQVVGEKAHQHRALFLGLTFDTQIRETEQPANRRSAFGRKQRCHVQAQASAMDIAELIAFKGR
ncbi:hypothetical protein D3C71_1945870 [compost metagenome]